MTRPRSASHRVPTRPGRAQISLFDRESASPSIGDALAVSERDPNSDSQTLERVPTIEPLTAPCRACGRTVDILPTWPAERITCGALICRARAFWTADEWDGAARMATVRAAIGIELNELDDEALRRAKP